MAYVLSLRPESPMRRSFSESPYLRSCSPLKGDISGAALRNITPRNVSTPSVNSQLSEKAAPWLHRTENAPPGLACRSLLNLVHELETETTIPRPSLPPVSKSTTNVPTTVPHYSNQPRLWFKDDDCHEDIIMSELEEDPEPKAILGTALRSDSSQGFTIFYDPVHLPLPDSGSSDSTDAEHSSTDCASPPTTIEESPPPFRRWMSTLRKRHAQRRKNNAPDPQRQSIDFEHGDLGSLAQARSALEPLRRNSESLSSSLGFVTAAKSASITLASTSIAIRSGRGSLPSKLRVENHSSNFSDARLSTDSNAASLGPGIDEAAWLRSLQRRKILEELISSEESYVGDLKVLINDYFMLLASMPALPSQTRSSIQQNISQILQLHEELLGDLHNCVPNTDVVASVTQGLFPITRAKHVRFHSADLMPGRFVEAKMSQKLRHSLDIARSPDRRPRSLVADAKTAGLVAKIFNRHMKRFFAYEEYGAHWTTMSQDLTLMSKTTPAWQAYERGVEALSKVLASENTREANSRKALRFSDLLIKPIQRVCKYPLLFDDLCRHTPVYDDPESHTELEKALFRLQEAIREVNVAKDDPQRRRLIETTWQLQDRLAFQEKTTPPATVFRILGHVILCGVLHVAYQGTDKVKGEYMICVLYKSCLVLATTNRSFTPYNVVAAIALANATVEEPDNGRGVQCHTAPHTWKLVFEYCHRLFEVIMSACSAQEEEVWKRHLRSRISSETHDLAEGRSTMQDMFSSLSLDMKSIGPIFGQAESLVRRMSVHRAATLGPKLNTHQVIIKNTQAQKTAEQSQSTTSLPVTRSQSHLSTNHVPTLAPRRAERIRLETALEEVWTRDVLPYPGMAPRRSDNPIRASANSVMRKLSMASIASNFSKRSPSLTSLSHTRSEESIPRARRLSQVNLGSRPGQPDRRPAPAVVDFHNAPAAFLPTDFELEDPRPSSRRRRLANRAMVNDSSVERTKMKKVRRLSMHMISPTLPPSNIRTISNDSGATIRPPREIVLDKSKFSERKEDRPASANDSSRAPSSTGSAPKKFSKSKSRIFKFFM